jgi:hypothetical protein
MAQNYTRQSSFADGDTITAALFNNEFNQVVNAFAYSASSDSSTGHKHDGTSGQGGNIPQIGDIDFLNKIVVDNTNNRWGFYVQVSSGTVEQLRIQDGAIVPVTDDDIDLGTSSLEFKDLFLDGTAHIDTLDVDVNATVAGTLGVTGATTLSLQHTRRYRRYYTVQYIRRYRRYYTVQYIRRYRRYYTVQYIRRYRSHYRL